MPFSYHLFTVPHIVFTHININSEFAVVFEVQFIKILITIMLGECQNLNISSFIEFRWVSSKVIIVHFCSFAVFMCSHLCLSLNSNFLIIIFVASCVELTFQS